MFGALYIYLWTGPGGRVNRASVPLSSTHSERGRRSHFLTFYICQQRNTKIIKSEMLSQLIYSSNLGCHSFFDRIQLCTELPRSLWMQVKYLTLWSLPDATTISILCIIELCFVPPSSPEFQREHSFSWGTLTVSMV